MVYSWFVNFVYVLAVCTLLLSGLWLILYLKRSRKGWDLASIQRADIQILLCLIALRLGSGLLLALSQLPH